ncbi:MAG TPA: sugar ABC transporter permease [Anaerolineae bacterium]|nr:sugar ABC transporter permease [Anaerolineae bacterium]HOQ98136.1 sugar ABC transporter permease [Anaerolineae bacterium]
MQREQARQRPRLGISGSRVAPYALILPAFLVVFALAAYSCYWLVRMSGAEWSFGATWEKATPVGLENYRWLLFDRNSTLWESLRITAVFLVTTLVGELVIGFALALLLNAQIVGRSIYTAILIIPMVVMPSMVGMVWRLYFSFDGLINFFCETLFRVKLNWYGTSLALPAVIIVDIWEWTPFFVLIFLAGLQSLPREPYEAAIVDGASSWQILRKLTIPMLAPLILTATILRFMDILRIFDVIFVMFGGGPGTATTTLPLYIYRLTMVARNVGRGSAASVMLIILIVGLTYLLIRLFDRVRFEG